MSLTRSDTVGMYTASGSSSTSMTSSRLSLEKKMPGTNAPQLRALGNDKLTNLRKDRCRPGWQGYRLGSRSLSRNS